MGIWLSESIVLHPDKIEKAVQHIAGEGYGIIRTVLRNTNLTHRSPQTIDAVRRMVDTAHALGVRVALDCEPHGEPLARDMGGLFPDAIATRLVRAEARLVNGNFVVHVTPPHVVGMNPDFLGVEAAFLFQDGSRVQKIPELKYRLRYESEPYDTGFTRIEYSYTEGRPRNHSFNVCLSGCLPEIREGTVVVYARFTDTGLVDFWSPSFRKYYEILLNGYRDIALDGVGWDEPAIAGDWENYRYGKSYAEAFEARCGYALADKLYLLDEEGTSPESAKVRMDYYDTLNAGVVEAQAHLIAHAKELFGHDLLLGTHHTWQGEGGINDYRAGAVDYFQLNDSMDAGYTDCCWWDPGSVCYAYTLGSSLGRLTPSGEAEVNTWDSKPSNSLVQYNARLITLMDITWFNIWYGKATDTCLYPEHYTWAVTVTETRRHRKAAQLLKKAKPVVDIAILHGWETVSGVNRADIAGAHKTFCINTSRLFIERSVPFDWVDSRLLAEATVANGQMHNKLGSYSIIVLPYASILPRAVWQKCVEFVQSGGKLIFTGTPPDMDTEGVSLSEEFAAMMGMPQLTLAQYLTGIDAICKLDPGRPEQLDVSYPLASIEGRSFLSIEGEPHGLRSMSGNTVYLSDLDPRVRLLDTIGLWLAPRVKCFSDSILWRLYQDGQRQILVVAAKKDRKLEGIIHFSGRTLEFKKGLIALVEVEGSSLRIHGEGVSWEQIGSEMAVDETLHPDFAGSVHFPLPKHGLNLGRIFWKTMIYERSRY